LEALLGDESRLRAAFLSAENGSVRLRSLDELPSNPTEKLQAIFML
jgi:hypothetical protein